MTSSKSARRVSLKVEAAPNSLEAKLLAHVKKDPITPSREVMLRALKAFYLPWALEGEVSDEELKAIAQSAIEELQFRIFQIRQRYLNTEASGYRPAAVPNFTSNGAAASTPPPPEVSIEAMREAINPADLDDF
ncbi:hypothetical protein PN498_12045 [Oscillatoria sp. CS-180]|uniref:hypothetical protein n=1 Tax=Oscillatoria sp. CS-180 TaxID=3021720 RepID=UPI00232D7F8B|nr:hypothetical protein [Oscillatoria sp. CS-180]MDB9526723.1 hypothetical protein [Oscillatoria sp. CS-180]